MKHIEMQLNFHHTFALQPQITVCISELHNKLENDELIKEKYHFLENHAKSNQLIRHLLN